jgi:hypothetical protein
MMDCWVVMNSIAKPKRRDFLPMVIGGTTFFVTTSHKKKMAGVTGLPDIHRDDLLLTVDEIFNIDAGFLTLDCILTFHCCRLGCVFFMIHQFPRYTMFS